MAARTFVFGDIHGDFGALRAVLGKLPTLDADDTLVFLGDYLDRGPESAQLLRFLREEIQRELPAKIVTLRGNHEDGWLRVRAGGWPEFVLPPQNGCMATYRSYAAKPTSDESEPPPATVRLPSTDEMKCLQDASFFPQIDIDFMQAMPHFYEDEHAIYVHAGLPEIEPGVFAHPSEVKEPAILLWVRTLRFFTHYAGKRVVVGHTSTDCLPPELSEFTPEDPLDLWMRGNVVAIDTGAGKGGFLTAVELPSMTTYESR